MKTEFTTRHFEISDSLKERTESRLVKLQRYFDRILDARVVVSFERNRYAAEASLTANGTPLTSHSVADTDKAALEQVLDKLEAQVRRHKDRLTEKRRNAGPMVGEPAESETEEGIEEEAAAFEELENVVGEEAGDWKTAMTVPEAVAELRNARREALAFKNVSTGRPAVLFKRRDGRMGLVDIRLD
jgi:putative sigma-54 modulation protein